MGLQNRNLRQWIQLLWIRRPIHISSIYKSDTIEIQQIHTPRKFIRIVMMLIRDALNFFKPHFIYQTLEVPQGFSENSWSSKSLSSNQFCIVTRHTQQSSFFFQQRQRTKAKEKKSRRLSVNLNSASGDLQITMVLRRYDH